MRAQCRLCCHYRQDLPSNSGVATTNLFQSTPMPGQTVVANCKKIINACHTLTSIHQSAQTCNTKVGRLVKATTSNMLLYLLEVFWEDKVCYIKIPNWYSMKVMAPRDCPYTIKAVYAKSSLWSIYKVSFLTNCYSSFGKPLTWRQCHDWCHDWCHSI
jgi:hypothetical protein